MKKGALMLLVLLLACVSCCTSAEEEGVRIDEEHFPDDIFREVVMEYDLDKDGILSAEETEKVTVINVDEQHVVSLQGVEYLTGLKELSCYINRLTELDVSRNIKLETLNCARNKLTVLDLSHNPELRILNCDFNRRLTELNVSGNAKLEELYCDMNKLTDLDLSHNPELKILYCGNNELTELDISGNQKLKVEPENSPYYVPFEETAPAEEKQTFKLELKDGAFALTQGEISYRLNDDGTATITKIGQEFGEPIEIPETVTVTFDVNGVDYEAFLDYINKK